MAYGNYHLMPRMPPKCARYFVIPATMLHLVPQGCCVWTVNWTPITTWINKMRSDSDTTHIGSNRSDIELWLFCHWTQLLRFLWKQHARPRYQLLLFIYNDVDGKNLNLSDPPLFNRVIVVWSRIWKLKSLGNGMIQATASHAGVKSTNRLTRKFPSVFCKVSSPLTVVRSKYVVQHYFMQIWCNVNLLIYGDSPCETFVNKIYCCGRFSNAMCKRWTFGQMLHIAAVTIFSECKVFHEILCRSVCVWRFSIFRWHYF